MSREAGLYALIATGARKAQHEIAEVVRSCAEFDVEFACDPCDAIERAKNRSLDLCVINGDKTGNAKAAAVKIAKLSEGGVVFLEDANAFETSVAELALNGIVVVPKPLSKMSLVTAIRSVCAANMRLVELKEVNRSLEQKLEDLKFIDRAKIALIKQFGYSEDEAHKYIEKQAMNLRVTKREIAMNILRTYEN